MTESGDKVELPSRAELIWLVFLTVLASLFRFIGLTDDGISHFDEGVYVLWSSGSGYPFREFFAPPLYPFLVRVGSMLVGSTEVVAQVVSSLIGTATVPLVWWVARRWYGSAAAAATALLAAFSGIHVAFSRMALTDACFTFLFVLAIWLFSEIVNGAFHVKHADASDRPWRFDLGASRWALAAGLATGAAMNTKYNGFLVIVFAVGSLVLCTVLRVSRQEFSWRRGLCGLAVAAAVAAVVYLPWFWHVHSKFGYGRLLAHHRGYMTGWASWPANLWTLFVEQRTFSDLHGWVVPMLGVSAAMALSGRPLRDPLWFAIVIGTGVAGWVLGESAGWLLGPVLLIWLARNHRPTTFLHATWLMGLLVLTPLYRPYPRLMLPLVAAGWLALGAALAELIRARGEMGAAKRGLVGIRLSFVGAASAAAFWIGSSGSHLSTNGRPQSLKVACESVRQAIAVSHPVGFLVRPPVLVYVDWQPQFAVLDPAKVDEWLAESPAAEPRRLLFVDLALLRDNPAARDSLRAATERLHERARVEYRPGLSVLMDDFGADARLAASDTRFRETYQLVLFQLEPARAKAGPD